MSYIRSLPMRIRIACAAIKYQEDEYRARRRVTRETGPLYHDTAELFSRIYPSA